MQDSLSFQEITIILKEYLDKRISRQIEHGSTGADESKLANELQNLDDTLKLLPKLEEGLGMGLDFLLSGSEASVIYFCGVCNCGRRLFWRCVLAERLNVGASERCSLLFLVLRSRNGLRTSCLRNFFLVTNIKIYLFLQI